MALSEGDPIDAVSGTLIKAAGAVIAPALLLPRLMVAAADQLVTAWEAVQAIPQIRDSLSSIEYDTRTMTDEVSAMRAGVDRLEGGMAGLTATVDMLGERMEDMGKVVRPLKRIGDRFRSQADPAAAEEQIVEAVVEAAAERPAAASRKTG